jgi:hypothetical protein
MTLDDLAPSVALAHLHETLLQPIRRHTALPPAHLRVHLLSRAALRPLRHLLVHDRVHRRRTAVKVNEELNLSVPHATTAVAHGHPAFFPGHRRPLVDRPHGRRPHPLPGVRHGEGIGAKAAVVHVRRDVDDDARQWRGEDEVREEARDQCCKVLRARGLSGDGNMEIQCL